MYCTKCGAENSDAATFCRKCGTLLEKTEVETRVVGRSVHRAVEPPALSFDPPSERNLTGGQAPEPVFEPANTQKADDAEAEIFSINSTLIFVYAGYAAAAIAALFLVAITAAFTSISTAWAVLIGLLLFVIPGYYHLRQKLVRYKLTDSKLEIDHGLVSRVSRKIPLRAIQDVTVSRSIPQRIFGFGDVVIDNSSEQGGKVVLRNINTPDNYADLLLRQMRRIER